MKHDLFIPVMMFVAALFTAYFGVQGFDGVVNVFVALFCGVTIGATLAKMGV